MGSIGFGEIILLLVIALLIFGPRRLPEIGKAVGAGIREFQQAVRGVQAEQQPEAQAQPLRPMATPVADEQPPQAKGQR